MNYFLSVLTLQFYQKKSVLVSKWPTYKFFFSMKIIKLHFYLCNTLEYNGCLLLRSQFC